MSAPVPEKAAAAEPVVIPASQQRRLEWDKLQKGGVNPLVAETVMRTVHKTHKNYDDDQEAKVSHAKGQWKNDAEAEVDMRVLEQKLGTGKKVAMTKAEKKTKALKKVAERMTREAREPVLVSQIEAKKREWKKMKEKQYADQVEKERTNNAKIANQAVVDFETRLRQFQIQQMLEWAKEGTEWNEERRNARVKRVYGMILYQSEKWFKKLHEFYLQGVPRRRKDAPDGSKVHPPKTPFLLQVDVVSESTWDHLFVWDPYTSTTYTEQELQTFIDRGLETNTLTQQDIRQLKNALHNLQNYDPDTEICLMINVRNDRWTHKETTADIDNAVRVINVVVKKEMDVEEISKTLPKEVIQGILQARKRTPEEMAELIKSDAKINLTHEEIFSLPPERGGPPLMCSQCGWYIMYHGRLLLSCKREGTLCHAETIQFCQETCKNDHVRTKHPKPQTDAQQAKKKRNREAKLEKKRQLAAVYNAGHAEPRPEQVEEMKESGERFEWNEEQEALNTRRVKTRQLRNTLMSNATTMPALNIGGLFEGDDAEPIPSEQPDASAAGQEPEHTSE